MAATFSLGTILISSPCMDDPNFHQSVIFIVDHSASGTIAFIINKNAGRALNELVEFRRCQAFPLYHGGPVDTEHLFFIHQRNDLITGGSPITNNIYLGGDFKQALVHINNKSIAPGQVKVFIGYCGWNANELEQEIEEGSWIVMNSSSDLAFGDNTQFLLQV